MRVEVRGRSGRSDKKGFIQQPRHGSHGVSSPFHRCRRLGAPRVLASHTTARLVSPSCRLNMSCLASAFIAVCAAVPARRIATARAAGSQRPVRVSAPGGAASTGRHQKAAFVPSSRRGGRVVADAVTDPDTADAFGVKKMNPEDIPPTALQFMVEMSCGKCVAAVESAVAAVAGVEAVTAALDTNTVRVVARLQQSDDVIDAITRAGYKCRLIGSGDVEGFGEDLAVRLGTDLRTLRQSLAAVAEFKGEVYGHGDVAGVVRFVAVNESTCLVEGAVQGLVPHGKYAVTVRTSIPQGAQHQKCTFRWRTVRACTFRWRTVPPPPRTAATTASTQLMCLPVAPALHPPPPLYTRAPSGRGSWKIGRGRSRHAPGSFPNAS